MDNRLMFDDPATFYRIMQKMQEHNSLSVLSSPGGPMVMM